MLHGVDISEHQTDVDYDLVATTQDFAIVRASYSDFRMDSQAWTHRTQLRDRGLLIGHYHYAVPNKGPAPLQARVFLDAVGWSHPGDILALDIEEDHPNLVSWAAHFIRTLINVTGSPGFLYTNQDFINRYNWQEVADLGAQLWLASWGLPQPHHSGAGPWHENLIHQHTSEDPIDGFQYPVDGNTFSMDREAWSEFGRRDG